MRRLGAKQLAGWLVIGALALWYLEWRGEDIERNSITPVTFILDSGPPMVRWDTFPKPFARLKTSTAAPAPKKKITAPRPIRLRAAAGETVAVSVTAYCLRGRTRSGTLVREGIVAADPRVFPLGSEIDILIGDDTLGRFKVEDTGLLIKGRKLDLWIPDCAEARAFGRKRGQAALAAKIRR